MVSSIGQHIWASRLVIEQASRTGGLEKNIIEIKFLIQFSATFKSIAIRILIFSLFFQYLKIQGPYVNM